jgi:hypothetical protein
MTRPPQADPRPTAPDSKPGEGEGGPRVGERARAEQAARAEREAAALRANLRRRKDQQRAREGGDPGG